MSHSACMIFTCSLHESLQHGCLRLMPMDCKSTQVTNLNDFQLTAGIVLNMKVLPINYCNAHSLLPLSQALQCVWRHVPFCWHCYKMDCSADSWMGGWGKWDPPGKLHGLSCVCLYTLSRSIQRHCQYLYVFFHHGCFIAKQINFSYLEVTAYLWWKEMIC